MARMSIFERWLVKSPFRAWLQRGEIRAFLRWADLSPEACMLDMGCGTGVSSALILDALRPRCLAAFDFDSSMVGVAYRHLARHRHQQRLHLAVADATHIPYRDGLFDAVFESGVVHHIPDCRAAVRDVGRVPGPADASASSSRRAGACAVDSIGCCPTPWSRCSTSRSGARRSPRPVFR